MNEESKHDLKDYWKSLDTTSIYMPNELLAYHIYLLELSRKNKKTKEEKRELATIATYKKQLKENMEDEVCLKM